MITIAGGAFLTSLAVYGSITASPYWFANNKALSDLRKEMTQLVSDQNNPIKRDLLQLQNGLANKERSDLQLKKYEYEQRLRDPELPNNDRNWIQGNLNALNDSIADNEIERVRIRSELGKMR